MLEVKAKKEGREVKVEYDLGSDLAEVIEKWGEEVVFNSFVAHEKINIQRVIRSGIVNGNSDEAIQERITNDFKPGVTMRSTASPLATVKRATKDMTAEEKAALVAQLQALLED